MLDEIESGFIILKMIFKNKMLTYDFNIVEINVPFEEITGMVKKDFVGMNYSMIKQDLMFLGFDWLEEYRSLAVDQKFRSREIYMEERKVHLRIRTFIPQPGYLAILVSDITPIRKAEKDTHTDDQKMITLLKNCRDGFLFFSADEKITSVSENIQEVLGFTENELKESMDLNFLGIEDKQKVKEAIHHILIHPRIAYEIEFQVIQKDGTKLWFEGTFHNMLQSKGINSIVLRLKEITRKKHEESEFYRITSRLLTDYPI